MNWLEELVESILIQEKAITSGQAETEGHALFISRDGGLKFILYEPLALLSVMDGTAYQEGTDGPENVIVGYIKISNKNSDECDGVWTVSNSAAREGYGPLMYDIAMSHISPQYMTADRDSVTPEAHDVWKFYYSKRREEFNTKPLEDLGCSNINFSNKDAINFAFSMKQRMNLRGLLGANAKVMNQFDSHLLKNVEATLKDLADGFFDLRYES